MKLERLVLSNFKCHAALDLPLGDLTVLTGFNSAGKSSIHQALALLAQSTIDDQPPKTLSLKGSLVDLGQTGEVLNQMSGGNAFGLILHFSSHHVLFNVTGDRKSSTPPVHTTVGPTDIAYPEIAAFLRGCVYLTTQRPAVNVLSNMVEGEARQRIGPSGDGCVSLLYALDQQAVSESLCVPDVPPTLPRQVEAWMRRFFPGFAMDIQPAAGTSGVLALGMRTSDQGNFHAPANVGFGLSYLLPIMTALLHTPPGSMLVLETPDAHIHPSAQSLMGRLIAQVAASGVQVMVETHSDHLVNGIRMAVKDRQCPAEAVKLHFFGGHDEAGGQVRSIPMDARGMLAEWPEGFCDQYDTDLARLVDLDGEAS